MCVCVFNNFDFESVNIEKFCLKKYFWEPKTSIIYFIIYKLKIHTHEHYVVCT